MHVVVVLVRGIRNNQPVVVVVVVLVRGIRNGPILLASNVGRCHGTSATALGIYTAGRGLVCGLYGPHPKHVWV